MFREIEAIPNLPEMEKEKIQYWDKIAVVERLKELRKASKERVYYDGPITANNLPHYGHAITWTLKDIVPRYWSMKNYFVSRNMGWDCQGLLVEIEVEKALGLKDRKDVEKFGIAEFNKACRESVLKYRDEIFKYEKRLGRWFDEADMYYTMDAPYIESMWWSFKTLYEKGLIYKGHKVVPYSPKAGTILSHHEVAEGGYKEVEDPFVTVKFPLKTDPNTFFLAWTTTPWTIPGNLMLAVGKKLKYAKVLHAGSNYILAESKVEDYFGDKEHKVVEKLAAKDLEGSEYVPPFDFYKEKRVEGCFKVIYAGHVSDEEGTGIVHLAPYGEEDFNIFMKMEIKIFDYLDSGANFTDEIPDYSGKFYADANAEIVSDLEKKDALFSSGKIKHRVPMCYRTHVPLIYKPIESWYVAVTKLKPKLLKENEKVDWVPDHIKTGMSYQWLSNARDWAVSRSRYWGTPMPVWVNDKTGETFIAGSFEEIEKLSGVKIEDPHRPYIDEITWEGKNGGTFRRIPEVLDAWYDSGSVPFAKLHYPFENKDLIDKRIKFPAEYIAEGDDQVHLWFYTMHVLGVALFGEIPYKAVVVNGMMADKNGEKLSKSKRNFPPMDEVLDKYGADVLRLFLLTSPIVQAEAARFYDEALDEVRKNFSIILWNSLRYFTTYANSNNWKARLEDPRSNNVLDKWIVARMKKMTGVVTENMDSYRFMPASRELVDFVQDLSTWYIRRSRDRIRGGDEDAVTTLYYVLVNFSKVMAPMVPFIAEELYSVLDVKKFSGLDSIHLDLFPEFEELNKSDEEVLKKMDLTRDVVSAALSVREESRIKIRQPLGTLTTNIKEIYEDLVKDEVNVKEIVFEEGNDDVTVNLDTILTEELKIEGMARELIRTIQGTRKKMDLAVSDVVDVVVEDSDENKEVLEKFGEEIKSKVLAKNLELGPELKVQKVQ